MENKEGDRDMEQKRLAELKERVKYNIIDVLYCCSDIELTFNSEHEELVDYIARHGSNNSPTLRILSIDSNNMILNKTRVFATEEDKQRYIIDHIHLFN